MGGLIISPTKKVVVGGETQLSATDRTLFRPDQTRLVGTTVGARVDRTLDRVQSHSIGCVRSCWRRSGTSLDSIGCCTLCIRSSSAAASGHAKDIVVMKNSVIGASGHYFAQRSFIAVDACCCRATDQTRPVTSTEIVLSRSCVRLGSDHRAWTMLDILGLLLYF